MKISVICFTKRARQLAETIFHDWEENPVSILLKQKENASINLQEWTALQFQEKNAVIVVGACGIAVRLIAPFVSDKLTDSPVLVIDEAGQFVIPVLSGHVGGANELAEKIAKKVGALPVITTATEVNQTFSVDLFAKKNQLTIENKEGIARISSKILEGQMVDIVISGDLTELKQGILRLKPKEYVLGIGCKKGKSFEEIRDFIQECLWQENVETSDVFAIASIDLKKEEMGIIRWANSQRIPFLTYSTEELQKVSGTFTASDFVKEQTGVENVCERAALAAAGENGRLLLKKQAKNGMTLAIAKRDWKFQWKKQEGIIIDET